MRCSVLADSVFRLLLPVLCTSLGSKMGPEVLLRKMYDRFSSLWHPSPLHVSDDRHVHAHGPVCAALDIAAPFLIMPSLPVGYSPASCICARGAT